MKLKEKDREDKSQKYQDFKKAINPQILKSLIKKNYKQHFHHTFDKLDEQNIFFLQKPHTQKDIACGLISNAWYPGSC